MKYSKGPWRLEDCDRDRVAKMVDADGEFVSFIHTTRYMDGRPDPQSEANATLIASAPELLRQLKALVVQLEHGGHLVPPGVTDAIAKAEGGDKQ